MGFVETDDDDVYFTSQKCLGLLKNRIHSMDSLWFLKVTLNPANIPYLSQ